MSYSDKWNSFEAYLEFMRERLLQLYRVLKKTGSMYLHIDPTASHYLKVEMDKIFGMSNFRNEIIWYYRNIWSRKCSTYQKAHDVILFYSKNGNFTFNTQFELTPHKAKMMEKGWDRNLAKGVRQLIVYDWDKAEKEVKSSKYDRMVDKTNANPGSPIHDNWVLPSIASNAKERTGYPTQKPLALLERIIGASSNPGDLVLDPFCGSGTSVVAAYRLGRNYLGCDSNPDAVRITNNRLIEEWV